ncbi:hypothetical protein J5X98_21905 [Leptothermofonsia sichuanensis E412]|uniref:hypothetical protein n=1 Tax=Leptothermofonsia sichuanensis TaxID=2917832 RepID=UPI001CA793D8|nr:hypothetical protein [Leptothermofonsia sichuanensis]QZZ19923.1 hypothetical protein J5X98_21905 [Leptothermofonsia sichuanensis E412]
MNKLNFNRWLNQRQLDTLKEAYQAAQEIRALEEHYFAGGKIAYTPQQSKIVVDYVKSLRDRQLTRVRINLAQFRVGAFLFNHQQSGKISDIRFSDDDGPSAQTHELPSPLKTEILEKLQFIESVVGKYRDRNPDEPDLTAEDLGSELSISHALQHLNMDAGNQRNGSGSDVTTDPVVLDAVQGRSSANRSNTASALVKGFTQVGKELTPEYEQQVIHELRLRRKQNKLAVRWLLILILIPIAIQVVAKNLIFEPLLDNYGNQHPGNVLGLLFSLRRTG